MKKLILCLTILLCIPALTFANSTSTTVSAQDEKEYFAKVQSTGVQFCSSPSEASALFEIPYSYFVKVGYVVDDYFKVTYRDLEGYVKKESVTLMDGTPITPYASATYKLFVPYALYESASQTSAIVQLDESVTINYYGTKTGQQVMSNNNVWYYSSVQIDGRTYNGYVFSGVTDLLTKISVNNETFAIVSEDILTPSSTTNFTSLSTSTKIMLIVAISVPSLLILYFLIKPSKIMQATKTKKKTKIEPRKIRHGDYFEFDETQL